MMEQNLETIYDESSATSEFSSPQDNEGREGSDAGSNRRISSRVRGRPAYFDASPAISIQKFMEINSPAIPKKTPLPKRKSVEISSSDVQEDDEGISKKPPPVNRSKTKGPLTITIKKGKMSSGKKTVMSVTGIDEVDRSNELTLFKIVKAGKSAIVSVINDWIDSYHEDKTAAMAELIQFFVHSSGCHANVTRSMIDAEDTVRAIRHLTENFGEEAEEYPLNINTPEYKKFKSNFITFILQLINLCQHNIIYDEEMMDILICWIIGLSDSQVRAFRHTSTVAGMKIVTGLVDVAIKVTLEHNNNQRQLDLEDQKVANKRSREKIERLSRRKEELLQYKAELEEMVNRIFSSIFIHRYRDLRPEIRSVCLSEMGVWMDLYSTYFLDQNYLKYFGWTLYDKVGDVRLVVLRALEKLYTNEDYLEHLELFTSRFKDRMIHMTLDVDTEVAVQAIKIASLLYKYDALEEDDCSQVEQLVFCDQRRMAHAAGEFLALRIIRLSIEASPQKLKIGRKEDYLRQMNIKAILDFFIKTEIHDHCAYIVDSLWEHTNLLKDWKTMTNLLLDTNSLIELEDIEESALIDLMYHSCKQAATFAGPPGRVLNRKFSQKDKKQHIDDRLSISTHFMEHLPDLVEKYKADVSKVRDLLTIPQFFDLEIYPEKRLTKHLDDLLRHIEDVMLKHSDVELLETCSQTYTYLMDNELVIQQTVEISRNRLIDEIVDKFKTVITNGIPNADDEKESDSHYRLFTCLKRISAFYQHHDLNDWGIYDDINAIIDHGVNGSVEDEVLILAIRIAYFSLLMSLGSFNVDNEIDKAELKVIRRRQKKYVKQMDELFQFSTIGVKTEVFKIFCDFFVYFAKQLLNRAPQLAPIVCEADASLQVRMRDFVISHVFNTINEEEYIDDEEDDRRAQELYNKRVLLCGLCKLIGYQMFDSKLAAPIYAQFLRAYADYSDIIKLLMQKVKEANIIAFSKVLLFALQQAFERLREDGDGTIETSSAEFNAIKDLARRFALMLGVNINHDNTRKSTITIHREGVTYAFSYPNEMTTTETNVPPNLLFLEILHEFTYRLIKVDRKVVMTHLEKTAGDMLVKRGQLWAPMRTYKNGIYSGSNVSKITGATEKEMEAQIDAEMNAKKRSISFADPPVTPAAHPDKSRARKKLSMNKADNSIQYISEAVAEKAKKTAPRVAKSIPKGTRKSPRALPPQHYEEPAAEICEEVDEDDSDEEEEEEVTESEIKMCIKRTSQEGYMVISPTKMSGEGAENMQGKKRKEETTPQERPRVSKYPNRRVSTASTPVHLNTEEAKRSQRKRKPEESDNDEEMEYEREDSNHSGDDVSTQRSWLATQQRASAKVPRKSYSMRSTPGRKDTDETMENYGDISESSQDLIGVKPSDYQGDLQEYEDSDSYDTQ